MSWLDDLAGMLSRAIGGRTEVVLVRIEEDLGGTAFGWGPEVDDFAEELARITRRLGGEITHRARTSAGHQLTLRVVHARRWLEEVQPLIHQSAIGAAASFFVADQRGGWRPLR